ncbi:MAG TPA: DUF6084 family protein [Gaiellales bacterium]|jgi:hypothetical protein|nr:DUF6084 family protein [Gaiellales bacterium]
MAELDFAVAGAQPDPESAAPAINLRLRITETSGTPVQAVALRTQIRIEPVRRRYDDAEAEGLRDLFGERARWGTTLKPLQLAFANQVVPGFTGSTEVDLGLPCSYDFDVAAHKYLYALETGEVPLLLLFSGTVFTSGPNGFSVTPIGWDKEATFRLPVDVWRETMRSHFPGTAWLRIGTESFDALHRYRIREQLLDWDQAIGRLLKEAQG